MEITTILFQRQLRSIRSFALLLVIIGVSAFGSSPVRADAGMAAAATVANGGLSACAANTGKALYNCVADVLDKLSNDITAPGVPETRCGWRRARRRRCPPSRNAGR